MKTITVGDDNWERLTKIKLSRKLRNLDMVITLLLKKGGLTDERK